MLPARSGPFAERVARLPRLGLGISTEFGARRHGLDILALRDLRPDLVQFLEVGADLERGVDEDVRAWVARGLPATYHFLDVNLEEPEDLEADWVRETAALAKGIGAAWLCGDAGLWHVGPRDRGHGTLLPPILVPESATAVAASVALLRDATGFEVFPETPPAHAYVGPLHLLDYFARAVEAGDTGLLLDVSHLAMFQHSRSLPPLAALDGFPMERIVEVHVAGSRHFEHRGVPFLEDDHGPVVLEAAWTILEHVVPRATNLRAVVVEAERNSLEEVVPLFERVRDVTGALAGATDP